MIKILGRANSINVQKVMWCAAELGVQVARADIGGPFGGNDTQDYLGKNPNGKIPTLVEDEFTLWESNAIVRYLCEKHGTRPWYPEQLTDRAHANQWMDWYLTTLHPFMTVIFWQLIRTAPEDRDAEAVQSARDAAASFWTILDGHLSNTDFLIGDEPSMADIPVGCAAYRWHEMDIDRPNLKHLKSWSKRLTDRAAYRQHVMLPLT